MIGTATSARSAEGRVSVSTDGYAVGARSAEDGGGSCVQHAQSAAQSVQGRGQQRDRLVR